MQSDFIILVIVKKLNNVYSTRSFNTLLSLSLNFYSSLCQSFNESSVNTSRIAIFSLLHLIDSEICNRFPIQRGPTVYSNGRMLQVTIFRLIVLQKKLHSYPNNKDQKLRDKNCTCDFT